MSKTDTASTDGLNMTKAAIQVSSCLSKKLVPDSEGHIVPDKDILKEVLEAVDNAPTLEEIKKVQTFEQDYTAGALHALGTVGSPFLDKHKKVNDVHMEKLPFVKNHLRANLARTKVVSSPGGKSTEYSHYLEGKFVNQSAGTSGAQVKRIRDHFATASAAAAAE
jgi:hypothetical protein